MAFFGQIGLKFQWPANGSVARNDKRCLGCPDELLRGDCSRWVRSGVQFGLVLLDPGLRMDGHPGERLHLRHRPAAGEEGDLPGVVLGLVLSERKGGPFLSAIERDSDLAVDFDAALGSSPARRALPPGRPGVLPWPPQAKPQGRRSPEGKGSRSSDRVAGRARTALAWRDREAACSGESGVGSDQRSRRRAGRAAGGTRARHDGPPLGAAVNPLCAINSLKGLGRCGVSPLGGVVEGAEGDRWQGRGSSLPLGSVCLHRCRQLGWGTMPLIYGRVVFQKREVSRREEAK